MTVPTTRPGSSRRPRRSRCVPPRSAVGRRILCRQSTRLGGWLAWLAVACLGLSPADAQPVVLPHGSVQFPVGPVEFPLGPVEADEATIQGWVEDLSSDSYLRRRRATQDLVAVGPRAVPHLVDVLGRGDLESTERAVAALQQIAINQPFMPRVESTVSETAPGSADQDTAGPDDSATQSDDAETATADGGEPTSSTAGDEAWEALERLAGMGGSRAARATQAISEVRQVRRKLVTQRLMRHGIHIGNLDVVLRARNTLQRIVQIGEDYSGTDELLSTLRWVDKIGMARVEGPAIRRPVLAAVAEMPDLHTISLVQGDIDWAALKALGDLPPIRHLEFRYVPLDAEMVDYLATLPITVSLTLNGTGAPAERVAALKASLPGLDVEFKQGGFLGVKCYDSVNTCVINEVVADSGAEAAGLIPGDVITAVDGKPIRRFSDLQEAINAHLPGDQIELSYRRAELERTTKAKLGKLVEN